MSLPEIPFAQGAKVRVTQVTAEGTFSATGTVIGPAWAEPGWGVAIQFDDGPKGWVPVETVTAVNGEDGA